MELAEELRRLEETLLQIETRRDALQVDALLADGFREFASSGRAYSKAEIIEHLQQQEYVPMSLTNFEVIRLSPSVALATCRVLRRGGDGVPVESLRSSVWELRDGRWQMVFHQGTKIPAE